MNRPLDVVVVSGPEVAPLRRCLTSVRAHLGDVAVHVGVNRAPTAPDPDAAALDALVAEFPDVSWTPSGHDLGVGPMANRLITGTTGDLLLLHSDAELLGPLTAARAALAGDRVAVVSTTVAVPDGTTERPWDVAHRPATLVASVAARAGLAADRRGTRWDDRYPSPPSEVDGHLAAGHLLISRAAWDEVGPFNERLYFLFGEDREWQTRAREHGWRLLLVDEPQVRHHGDADLGAGQPPHRIRDLELASAAAGLGMNGNRGPGAALLAADLVLGRLQPSRRRFRRTEQWGGDRHHVVITTPKISIGGAERQRVLLANELAGRGHPVTLVCLRELGHLQRELHPGVRLVLRPWWQPVVDIPGDAAVLISGTTNIEVAFGAAWSAATGAGTPQRRWLVAAHRGPWPDRPTFTESLAKVIRRSHGVIALSEGHWRDLTMHQRLHDRHWCVPNGVDLQEDRGYHPHHPLRVGFLGRLVKDKNLHVLVDALAQHADLGWTLEVFGGGPDEDWIKQLVPAEVTDRVHWHGRTPGPAPALAGMDVLCLPSRLEAFPLVLLEAMACGIPTMASAICAIPEILDHGRAGIVVPTPALEDWAEALWPVLTDPESLGKVARAGWERVEAHYTVSAMVDGYQKVMAEALATR